MICDLCKKREAVIFIEQSSKTFRRKICLCRECAAARGVVSAPVIPDNTVMASLFEEVDRLNRILDTDALRLCPVCGKSLADIKKTGHAGCPECYSVFSGEIRESMRRHGIAGTYSGSMPRRLAGFRNALTDRADLQAKLEESVRREDYEKAAVYRDYLRALERGSVAGPGPEEEADDGRQ